MRLPIVWPDGTYGLPKTWSGCPNTNGVTFATGWCMQDTEDRHPNLWSTPLHLAGIFKRSEITRHFCIKDIYIASNTYHTSTWPKGFYCINKYGNCPTGFTEGGIYWDDENHHNENKRSGTLPDGVYGRNTLIYYCCRKDEARGPTWPIYLPTGHPFYLIRIGGHCQKVGGMKVNDEWVYWNDEYKHNKDKRIGLYPDDDGGSKNHLLHYCYYYK